MKCTIFVLVLSAVLLAPRPAAAAPLPEFALAEAGGAFVLGAAFGLVVMSACGFDIKVPAPTKAKCELAAGGITAGLLGVGIPMVIIGRRQLAVSSAGRLTFTAMTSGGALGWTERF